jgi:hypothetical protein
MHDVRMEPQPPRGCNAESDLWHGDVTGFWQIKCNWSDTCKGWWSVKSPADMPDAVPVLVDGVWWCRTEGESK